MLERQLAKHELLEQFGYPKNKEIKYKKEVKVKCFEPFFTAVLDNEKKVNYFEKIKAFFSKKK
jgi:hypothetical protein